MEGRSGDSGLFWRQRQCPLVSHEHWHLGYTGKIFVSETGPAHSSRTMYQFLFSSVFSRSPAATRPRDTISFYLLDPLHDPRLLRSPFSSAPSIQGLSASGRPAADKARKSWRECTWTGHIRLQVDTGVTFSTSFSPTPCRPSPPVTNFHEL